MPLIELKVVGRLALLLIAIVFGANVVSAENLAFEPKNQTEWAEAINQGTVRVLTKGLTCTCMRMVSDMAKVLNDPGRLRILPVIGDGSLQGIADLIYLNGIDLSILQADALVYARRNEIHPEIDSRIHYVTKLYDSEVHLIASYGSKTIHDLDGKLVAFDVEGGASFITAQNIFENLGIEVLPVYVEHDAAIEQLRRGDVAAVFFVTGKPADFVRQIEPGDGLHFLSVPMISQLGDTYAASTLTDKDYPKLIAKGDLVQTIAVPEVLTVYNWAPDSDRYAKVSSVVETFLDNIEALQEPYRHPKWRDIDPTAKLPGWQRFQPVEDWLNGSRSTKTDEEMAIEPEVDQVSVQMDADQNNKKAEGRILPPQTPNNGMASGPRYDNREDLQKRWTNGQ